MTTEIREEETEKAFILTRKVKTAQTEQKHDANEIFAKKTFPQCQVSFLNCSQKSIHLKYSILCRTLTKNPEYVKRLFQTSLKMLEYQIYTNS